MKARFQSIGVTKDRRLIVTFLPEEAILMFPINRCHQGLATCIGGTAIHQAGEGFQSIGVTKYWRLLGPLAVSCQHLSGFQSIGVTMDWRLHRRHAEPVGQGGGFPINRRHQGLATVPVPYPVIVPSGSGFQSIGVTKDWRPGAFSCLPACIKPGFQSIGVTKDWRRPSTAIPLLI